MPERAVQWEATIWDPHRDGFKHSPTNAALVLALSQSYGRVRFKGRPDHLEAVRTTLLNAQVANDQIGEIEFDEVRRSADERLLARAFGRIGAALSFHRATRTISQREALLLVSSVTAASLRHLQRASRRLPPTAVVIHQTNDLVDPSTPHLMRLRRALEQGSPDLTLLSTTIPAADVLQRLAPRSRVVPLDLPYLTPSHHPSPSQVRPTRFVLAGAVDRSQLDRYVRICRAVREAEPSTRFSLAGFVRGPLPDTVAPVDGVSNEPLDYGEVSRRLSDAHWAVLLAPESRYRVRLSASAQDAICHRVPIISSANPFIEDVKLRSNASTLGHTALRSDDEIIQTMVQVSTTLDLHRRPELSLGLERAARLFDLHVASEVLSHLGL